MTMLMYALIALGGAITTHYSSIILKYISFGRKRYVNVISMLGVVCHKTKLIIYTVLPMSKLENLDYLSLFSDTFSIYCNLQFCIPCKSSFPLIAKITSQTRCEYFHSITLLNLRDESTRCELASWFCNNGKRPWRWLDMRLLYAWRN